MMCFTTISIVCKLTLSLLQNRARNCNGDGSHKAYIFHTLIKQYIWSCGNWSRVGFNYINEYTTRDNNNEGSFWYVHDAKKSCYVMRETVMVMVILFPYT